MAVGVFPGFLPPVLTQLFFPEPPATVLTYFRGERRKYAGKKVRHNRVYSYIAVANATFCAFLEFFLPMAAFPHKYRREKKKLNSGEERMKCIAKELCYFVQCLRLMPWP